jgi:hypothetical protein
VSAPHWEEAKYVVMNAQLMEMMIMLWMIGDKCQNWADNNKWNVIGMSCWAPSSINLNLHLEGD